MAHLIYDIVLNILDLVLSMGVIFFLSFYDIKSEFLFFITLKLSRASILIEPPLHPLQLQYLFVSALQV